MKSSSGFREAPAARKLSARHSQPSRGPASNHALNTYPSCKMKTPILVLALIAAAGSLASAAEYEIFRVCQDQRVIHTSDGAEAGRVEYIVVDPSDRQVISTIVTGGVIGERLVDRKGPRR